MGLLTRPARQPEDNPADAELLRRAAAGHRRRIGELAEDFRRPAFSLPRRFLADDSLAEDVLQDVFVTIWRNPGAFDTARGSVASWVLSMVHHKAVDAVRREESHRRRQVRAEEDVVLSAPTMVADVADQAWAGVVAGRVRAALNALPEAQREALTLAYYGGYTQREVAALTGAPLGTVKTRMLAGMRRLKSDLDGVPGSLPAEGGAR